MNKKYAFLFGALLVLSMIYMWNLGIIYDESNALEVAERLNVNYIPWFLIFLSFTGLIVSVFDFGKKINRHVKKKQ